MFDESILVELYGLVCKRRSLGYFFVSISDSTTTSSTLQSSYSDSSDGFVTGSKPFLISPITLNTLLVFYILRDVNAALWLRMFFDDGVGLISLE